MNTISLEPRLGFSQTRSDFLRLMPVLRKYILSQVAELPQKDVKHTIYQFVKQLPELSDDDDKCVIIVGCIDTEKHPYQTFWTLAEATLGAYKAITMAQTAKTVTAEEYLAGTVGVVSSAFRTYVTGIRIYNAARYAYTKPVEQNRLGAYWDRVKVL